LIVMSATLDAGCSRLPRPCEVLVSQGRSFPVRIELTSEGGEFRKRAGWTWRPRMRRIAGEAKGDMLVFMPGAYEISRTVQPSRPQALRDFVTFPLHASCRRTAGPRRCALRQREIIVSTNVAGPR